MKGKMPNFNFLIIISGIVILDVLSVLICRHFGILPEIFGTKDNTFFEALRAYSLIFLSGSALTFIVGTLYK